MPTRSNSNSRLPNSKPKLQPARKQSSQLGSELVKSLQQATAHFRGERQLRSYEYRIPERINVRAVRRKSGLSQAEFAARYGLNARTVQEWEQGRAEPDLAARAYLTVIARNPEAVEEALARTA